MKDKRKVELSVSRWLRRNGLRSWYRKAVRVSGKKDK